MNVYDTFWSGRPSDNEQCWWRFKLKCVYVRLNDQYLSVLHHALIKTALIDWLIDWFTDWLLSGYRMCLLLWLIKKCFLYWEFTIPADATLIFDVQLLSMQWMWSYQLKNDCSQPAAQWIGIDLKSCIQLHSWWFYYQLLLRRLRTVVCIQFAAFMCQKLTAEITHSVLAHT